MVPPEGGRGSSCYYNYHSVMEHGPHDGDPATVYFTKRPTTVDAGDVQLESAMGNTLQLMLSLFTALWYDHNKLTWTSSQHGGKLGLQKNG